MSEGYLTLTGRIKELINRGGEKISPLEVRDNPHQTDCMCLASKLMTSMERCCAQHHAIEGMSALMHQHILLLTASVAGTCMNLQAGS